MKRSFAGLLVTGLVVLTGCLPGNPGGQGTPDPASTEAPSGQASAYPHLRMGNPSRAREDPKDRDNYLMKKEYFALSYHDGKGMPNWVSWRLVKDDLGDVRRAPFFPDQDLPHG